MKNISEIAVKQILKETIMQFGEGGFLRAFVDWMFDKMNKQGVYEGSIVVVQPIENGMCDKLSEQNCVYTQLLRGVENGKTVVEKEVIDCISRCINPYTDFAGYLELAKNPDLRVIVSNTTESGIAYNESDKLTDAPPKSFPAKLTVFLYERFKLGLNGFIILPCELIDNNGSKLKEIILKYANEWNLGQEFLAWIKSENKFNNTLVDRIVTGYPKDEIEQLQNELGYEDNMINTGEIFHLWVIEGDKSQSEELPFTKAGLNVIWTNDQQPYRTRKVRILNGAHTSMVLAAHLYGLETVKKCIEDVVMNSFLKKIIFNEIIPTLDLPIDELNKFANGVLERFANPFIKHYLLSIALNSVSKFKVRVLPSITEYIARKGEVPTLLAFSLASLIAFYKTDKANDDADIMEFMLNSTPAQILSNTKLWDEDSSRLLPYVEKHLENISTKGMKTAIGELV